METPNLRSHQPQSHHTVTAAGDPGSSRHADQLALMPGFLSERNTQALLTFFPSTIKGTESSASPLLQTAAGRPGWGLGPLLLEPCS